MDMDEDCVVDITGTLHFNDELELQTRDPHSTESIFTDAISDTENPKFDPDMVISVPTGPDVGEMELIMGGGIN